MNKKREQERKLRVEQGLCRACGNFPVVIGLLNCVWCHTKIASQQRRKHAINMESNRCVNCGKANDRKTRLCLSCTAVNLQSNRERRKRYKLFIIDYFGGKCKECGETDIRVLTIDHVNNDGNLDKRVNGKVKLSGSYLYIKLVNLIKQGKILKDFQLLCFNCHAKKDLAPWWLK